MFNDKLGKDIGSRIDKIGDRSYPVLLRERDAKIKELKAKLAAADRLADAVIALHGRRMKYTPDTFDVVNNLRQALTAYTQTKDK